MLELKDYIPGKSIEEVQREFNPPVITKLGSNENALGPSPLALEAIRKQLQFISHYPDSSWCKLKAAGEKALGLDASHLVFGNGSDEILLMITGAFLNPGESELLSENTFSEYEFSTHVFDGEIIRIPLKNYSYDLEGFAEALNPEVRLVFLCNPNNPTGTYFSHAALVKLLSKVPSDTVVVVDEAYGDFATADDFPKTLNLIKDGCPNLVVVRTFSKLYGLASLRIGLAVAAPALAGSMARVRTPFNVNGLGQVAACEAWQDFEHVKRSLEMNREGMKQLRQGLSHLQLRVLDSEANFLCFHLAQSASEVALKLLEKGVIARPLKSFGLDEWMRVTVGTKIQNQHFLDTLKAVQQEPHHFQPLPSPK